MFLAPSAFQLRSKISPKLVLEAVWGLLGGLLGPSWPQEGPKSQQGLQNGEIAPYFWGVLGAMLALCWAQVGPKIDQNFDQNFDRCWDRFLIDLGGILG